MRRNTYNRASMCEFKLKVCLLGDPGVGKTSLVRRFVLDIYSDKYLTSLGVKVMKKVVILPSLDGRHRKVTMLIWDLLGQRDFGLLHETSMKGSQGIILVCDLTRPETAENLLHWQKDVKRILGNTPSIIYANKCDLVPEPDSPVYDQVREIACRMGSAVIPTSAKTGANVESAFVNMAGALSDMELIPARRMAPAPASGPLQDPMRVR